MRSSRALLVAVALSGAGAAVAAQSYVPQRVYASAQKRFADVESLAAAIAHADVVFVGEQHDSVNTHRLERTLLEAVQRRRGDVVLSLEMFERDVQEPLAHFSMGHIEESEFLSEARPWTQYARDYKPLVDFVLAQRWSIVAANVPRDIAAAVSTSGLSALDARPQAEQAWFAHDRECAPTGAYFDRFRDAMTGHEKGAPAMNAATLARYYESQCLKDETMAESIAQAYTAGSIGGKRPLVISVNGSFHSDYRDGTVSRTRRRLPGKQIVVITVLPVENLDTLKPDKDLRKRADWVVFTVK